MTSSLSQRHGRVLASADAQAFLASPGFPLPDATAIRRVGSTTPQDFLQTGLLLRAALEEAVGIAPDHAILDVGCGWGRLALPLAVRLGAQGRYTGMDAAAEAVAWCRRHVGEADARFRFHHADIRNSYANPRGRIPAERAVLLPWEERFDRVVAFSLFTHLLPDAMARYLAEAARLCRPGGALVATFFLLDEEARTAIAEQRTDRRFPFAHGIARIADPAVPEDAVAYDAGEVMALLDAAGFDAEWRPGAWCPRGAAPFEYQDLVVARRRGAAPAARGTRGAVTAMTEGAFRGWAKQADGAAAALRVEIDGQVVASGAADLAGRFTLPVPRHLLGHEVRDLRILAGAEDLPLLARPHVLLADAEEELTRAWRIETLRRGLWRIESIERDADGGVAGTVWAIPPRAQAAARAPRLVLGEDQAELLPTDAWDDGLAGTFGLPPGALRPVHRFRLPRGLPARGAMLRLVGSDGMAWEPVEGQAVPGSLPADAAALDACAAAAALRAATGLGDGALNPRQHLPAEPLGAIEAMPTASVRLAIALDGLDVPEIDAESVLVEVLARVVGAGGIVLAAMPGSAALLDGTGGPSRLLTWLRRGVVLAPEAPIGRRMVRSPAHLERSWGRHFEVLRRSEAALSAMRDLVVLRRRG